MEESAFFILAYYKGFIVVILKRIQIIRRKYIKTESFSANPEKTIAI